MAMRLEDEPMSAKEWCKKHFSNMGSDDTLDDLIEAFQAGAAENEKKHRLTQDYEHWYTSQPIGFQQAKISQSGKAIWQAHARATNTEA